MGEPETSCKGARTGAVWRLLLVPKAISVPVPPQDLDPITATTPENEQMPRERVEGHGRFDEVGERVEALPHVGRIGPEKDLHGRGPTQHGRPSNTARIRPRVEGSKPEGTRTIEPVVSTISIGDVG